jgi:hypothetical protein
MSEQQALELEKIALKRRIETGRLAVVLTQALAEIIAKKIHQN